jgi:hypothetical protein
MYIRGACPPVVVLEVRVVVEECVVV